MRRSRDKRPTGIIWGDTSSKINTMERAVVAKMVTPDKDITITDVLDWLIPPVELRLLRDAYPYADRSTGDIYKALAYVGVGEVQLHVNLSDKVKCVVPKDSIVNFQPSAPKADSLMALVNETTDITRQHNKLRKIVTFLVEQNATPGAVRHYFPTIQSLLPHQHAFHTVKGDRFKELHIDHTMSELLREAPEIIARGLLCGGDIGGYSDRRALFRVRLGDGLFHTLIWEK